MLKNIEGGGELRIEGAVHNEEGNIITAID
jgi:hypothetical protein